MNPIFIEIKWRMAKHRNFEKSPYLCKFQKF